MVGRGQGRGFTLIELLVVVAIISILASMLLPALQKTRQRVQGSVCEKNLQTQAMALFMYIEDNADVLPWGWYSTKDLNDYGMRNNPWEGYGGNSYALQIFPYINNVKVFTCDSYGNNGRRQLEAESARAQGFTGTMTWPLVYQLNGRPAMTMMPYKPNPYFTFDGYGFGVIQGTSCANYAITARKLARFVINTDTTVMLFDADRAWSPYVPSPACANTVYIGPPDGDRNDLNNYVAAENWKRPNIGLWHNARSNVVFFDGHVEPHDRYSTMTYLDLNDTHWKIGR